MGDEAAPKSLSSGALVVEPAGRDGAVFLSEKPVGDSAIYR